MVQIAKANTKQGRQCTYNRNIVVLLCICCFRGTGICCTYPECL